MPSLSQLRGIVTSHNPPQRPQPIEPVTESYEGENIPYRGTELHGVPMFDEPQDVPAWHEGREVVYEEQEPEQDPVPVRIVNTSGREVRRSRIFQVPAPVLDTPAKQVVGMDEQRSSVKVKNITADAVWIGNEAHTANSVHGWRLNENETYETTSQMSLWVTGSHASNVSKVAVSVDYAVEAP